MKNKERGIVDLKGKGKSDLSGVNSNLFFLNKETIEKRCEDELKKAALIVVKRESGSISKVHSAKRGNRSYANLVQNRTDSAVSQMNKKVDEKGGTILMMTLTADYNPTSIEGIKNSWTRIKEIWQPFSRWFRRNGFESYISIYEAHEQGGCHIHLVIYYKNELEAVVDKNRKSRLADKKFEHEIKKAWRRYGGGLADIQIADPLGATAYVSKELGRESHIEAALKRSKRDWTGKNDEREKSNDIKKLWGWYIACELEIRRYNMSRDLKIEALDKVGIGNSTEKKDYDKKDPITDWFIIPRADLKKGIFTKKPGAVAKNSSEYWRASYYFEKYPNEHKLSRERLRYMILKRLNERKKNKTKLKPPTALTLAMEAGAAV